MPRTPSPRHGDLAAQTGAKLRAEQDLLEAQAAEDLEIVNAQADLQAEEVIDMTAPKPAPEPEKNEPIVLGDEDSTFEIRTNVDIEDMTLGAGNFYTFKAGQRYRVTRAVRDHLEGLSLIWH